MEKIRRLTIIFACLLPIMAFSQDDDIRRAVEKQLESYPHSTLCDIYKNFFQDAFGPGHLISDTLTTADYLRRELREVDLSDSTKYESLGYKGNFYRVYLCAVKTNLIPFDVFFDAFLRSAKAVEPVSIELWRLEWKKIDSIIKDMNLILPDMDSDRDMLNKCLKNATYVMHHSNLYKEYYKPHYRIISKEIFEKELLPYFKR